MHLIVSFASSMGTGSEHLLAEVLCAFWFDPHQNPWDSTFFGKYHSLIESEGYTQKEEQQGYEFKFELKPNLPATAAPDKVESRMLFRNPAAKTVILLSAHYISFHKLAPYNSWEKLCEEQVIPGLDKYNSIGLGKGLSKAQMLYLNKYEFLESANLSDTFSFLPPVQSFGIGREKSLLFQAQYELEENTLQQIKLNTAPPVPGKRGMFLECSCIATNTTPASDWQSLIKKAHDTNNKVFNNITSK